MTKKLIPDLRFPEFVNDGDWQIKNLKDVAAYENGKAHEQGIAENGKFVVVNSKFISSNASVRKFTNTANCLAKSEETLMVLSDLPNGRALGKCFYVDKDDFYTVNQRICKITSRKIDSKILFYLLNRNPYFLSFDDGVKQTNLRNEDVLNFELLLPSNLNEQQKIASCLSSLDQLITAQKEKLELLKNHKIGLMQNLFPQEGETVPKFRFPEFENDGDWEEKKLKEVADFINGKAYNQDELLSDGKYRVLRVGNLFTNKNWYFSNLELDDDKYCEMGDLIYAWSASFGPYIWKEEKVIYHYHIWKVKNRIQVDRNFLYFLLDVETDKIKSQSLNGFALMHITKGIIENWEVLIPSSEIEQQKIASCFYSVDNLITSQTDKIEKLQLHKIGLMQRLFPKKV